MAEAEREKTDWLSAATVSLGTSVLLFAYVMVAVLKQSDAELVTPGASFDLGQLLDRFKDGIPGGSFVTPLLQIKLPLATFYTLGPALLLLLHAWLMFHPTLLREAIAPLRLATIWLPFLAIALIAWRFSPYVAARPEPPLLPRLMEVLQMAAFAFDGVLVIFALIEAHAGDAADWPGTRGRRTANLLRAFRHAALIWLLALVLAELLHAATAEPDARGAASIGGAALRLALPVALALVAAWLVEGWFARSAARPPFPRPWFQPSFWNGDIDMQGRLLIAVAFLVLAAFPAMGRALDLAGETLVARAPSETVLATLVTTNPEPAKWNAARVLAWTEYGRGIDLHGWNFEGARFDRATMANINLRGAKLRGASFDYANLIKADLTRADLTGASFRFGDLQQIKTTDFTALKLAQNTAPSPTAPAVDDPCAGVERVDRTDFSGSDFSGADLTGADLSCSILRGVKMDGKTTLKGVKLAGANLCGADLFGVDLSEADKANRAIFAHADLRRATLPSEMNDATLEGAYVAGTRGLDAKYLRAHGRLLHRGTPAPRAERVKNDCDKQGDPGFIPKEASRGPGQ